jgi:mannose-6-phosphate isomerase
MLIAEIQQASDTTFRLYDYDRLGPDGQPRPLHVAEALETIDYDYGPLAPQSPRPTEVPAVERLVDGPQFTLDRWTLSGAHRAGGDDRFHILAVVEGAVDVAGDAIEAPLTTGGVILLPAELGAVEVQARPQSVVLDAYLP